MYLTNHNLDEYYKNRRRNSDYGRWIKLAEEFIASGAECARINELDISVQSAVGRLNNIARKEHMPFRPSVCTLPNGTKTLWLVNKLAESRATSEVRA